MPYKDEHKPWKPGHIVSVYVGHETLPREPTIGKEMAIGLMAADDTILRILVDEPRITEYYYLMTMPNEKILEYIKLIREAGQSLNKVMAEARAENNGI